MLARMEPSRWRPGHGSRLAVAQVRDTCRDKRDDSTQRGDAPQPQRTTPHVLIPMALFIPRRHYTGRLAAIIAHHGSFRRFSVFVLLPQRRPQDNVRLGMAEAQEDEFALCITTSLSPYLGWVFPHSADHFERYLTFRVVPAIELTRWKSAFITFLQKLTLKYNRPLVLKSPPHTCRIRLLLEMFPDARFVHICRNPFTVFQSTRRLFDTTIPAMRLQTVNDRQLDERILRTGRVLYDAFFEERGLIPPGRFHELCFEELEKDPVKEIRNMYRALSLPGFDIVEPVVQNYVATLAGYRKNEYPDLPLDLRQRIIRAWPRCGDENSIARAHTRKLRSKPRLAPRQARRRSLWDSMAARLVARRGSSLRRWP